MAFVLLIFFPRCCIYRPGYRWETLLHQRLFMSKYLLRSFGSQRGRWGRQGFSYMHNADYCAGLIFFITIHLKEEEEDEEEVAPESLLCLLFADAARSCSRNLSAWFANWHVTTHRLDSRLIMHPRFVARSLFLCFSLCLCF